MGGIIILEGLLLVDSRASSVRLWVASELGASGATAWITWPVTNLSFWGKLSFGRLKTFKVFMVSHKRRRSRSGRDFRNLLCHLGIKATLLNLLKISVVVISPPARYLETNPSKCWSRISISERSRSTTQLISILWRSKLRSWVSRSVLPLTMNVVVSSWSNIIMALMEPSMWRSGWNNILLFSPRSLHWWRPSQGGVRMTDQILLIFLEIFSNCCPMIFSRSKIAIFTLLKFCTWADTSCRRISSIYRNIKN